MKRVVFGATYPAELAHPLHRCLTRTDGVSRMELLQWGPTASVTTLSWYDADRKTVGRLLATLDSVTRTHLVADAEGTYAFVRQTEYAFAEEVLDLISASEVVFRPPVTFRDDGDVRFEAVGETDALSDFYAGLNELLDARIERAQEFRRWRAPSDLTTRQRAALDAAVAVGYYERPRTGSLADVAAELDCATSTAGELLRRVETTLVSEYVARHAGGDSDGVRRL